MRPLVLAFLLVFVAACGSSNKALLEEQHQLSEQAAELAQLREQNQGLQDTIAQLDADLAAAREAGASEEDLRRMQQRIDALQQELTFARQGETIDVLLTDLTFESGSAALTPAGVERLRGIAERIQRDYPGRPIRVEGYTDTNPIGPALKRTYPSNWELSAARAAMVVRHFQWTHKMDPNRFEVVGFGPYHPVSGNDTEEGRGQNRRVRIAVLPATE